jgi:predicted enzyme related to lactoylglutathione lyase
MKVNEIAFVGYPVTDLKRARGFYEGTLGLKTSVVFGDEQKAWVEYDIGPGTLAISNFAPDWKPAPSGGSAALEVGDFQEAVDHLKRSGAKFTVEPMETPACHMAVVADPDGNSIIIHRRKNAAA